MGDAFAGKPSPTVTAFFHEDAIKCGSGLAREEALKCTERLKEMTMKKAAIHWIAAFFIAFD
ncbi:hypothetical protein [Pseudomonas purpurea]|uniref:hypothetical protein n=1 Tax=Pseudomonas purpurea TaxID=3136737 RepID=UPI0032668120